MSNVSLEIGGRGYTVASASGEEAHVGELGAMIDAMVSSGGLRGQGEARMLLFAALMLADELHDARRTLAATMPAEDAVPAAEIAQRVDHIARRLEALAQHLEDQATSA